MSSDPFIPITREQAASILSVSLTTLDELVKAGALPAPRSLGEQRRKYWHPAVFYSHLHQALTAEALAAENHGETFPSTQTSAVAREVRATINRTRKRDRAERHPIRTKGRLSVEARQAARINKLNE